MKLPSWARTALLRIGLLAACARVISGCSSSSSHSGWVGNWSCVDNFPDGNSLPAEYAVTQASNGDISWTPVLQNGGVPCTYVATTSGNTATIEANQPCDPGTHGGTLTLSGDSLVFTETFSDANGFSSFEGSCKRM